MGLINKVVNNTTPEKSIDNIQLDKKEIEFILLLIKQSTFKGEDVESVYNAVLKLQNQYININK